MKKLYISFLFAISFLLIANQGFSQVPNGGMETWITTGSYANPQYWDSPNTETTAIPIVGAAVLTKSSGAHSGSWCAKLETKSLIIANVPGAMVIGDMTIDIVNMSATITGGAPCDQQVPKITGYYKYAPVGGDTCAVIGIFTKHNLAGGTDTLGMAFFQTSSTVSAWTLFEAPVMWFSIENPDTVKVMVLSSASLNGVAGTILYVDDIALDFTSGVSEPLMAEQSNVFFNGLTSCAEVHLDLLKAEELSVNIYSISGQLVIKNSFGTSNQLNTSIPMDNLPAGMYFVEVVTGTDSHTTKIVKQ